ncbi:MAG: LuxR C-terminal-related transcriptional regulator [Acidimicrobiales bacterium]
MTSLVAQGMPNREIAEHVFLSYQTVRNRVSRIFDVAGVSNRTQLALAWRLCANCPDVACPANPAARLSPAGHVAVGDRPL